MHTLREIYENHSGRLLNKYSHYIDVYENFFRPYRNKNIVLLELGIAHGGSLEIWRKYFGPDVKIIGVDINPECKKFEEKNTTIYIGSQEDKVFLNKLKSEIPKVDILIEDGGHTMKQQITTFECMYEHVKDGGLYICEDTHTSYMKRYLGGYKRKNTFIEYAKNFIDDIHGWHFNKNNKSAVNSISKSVMSVHFYNSITLIEKQTMQEPQNTFKGQKTLSNHIESYGQKFTLMEKIKGRLQKKG